MRPPDLVVRHPLTSLRSPLLRLPCEIMQECYLYLVDVDPPQIHRPGQAHSPGWFSGIWTCHIMRYYLYRDSRLWARAYTQIPRFMGVVRAFARNIDLSYRVTPDVPYARRCSILYRGRYFDFTPRLQELLERADFKRCSVIELNKRWDALEHLKRLHDCSPLPRLRVLKVANDYEDTDTDDQLQRYGIEGALDACSH